MKHCLDCLVYLLSRNKNKGANREVKLPKSMLIRQGIKTSFTIVSFFKLLKPFEKCNEIFLSRLVVCQASIKMLMIFEMSQCA